MVYRRCVRSARLYEGGRDGVQKVCEISKALRKEEEMVYRRCVRSARLYGRRKRWCTEGM